jgi:hypothetical protein
MMTLYRENRGTIRTMILVCTLGGCCFFVLGIASSMQFLNFTQSGVEFTMNSYLVIPAMLLTLAIALTSLISSYFFSKFSKIWDRRQDESEKNEDALRHALEQR